MPNRKAAPQESSRSRNQPSLGSSDTKTSSEAPSAAVVETLEHRRFAEFCDACKRYRYIGLCYGAPGVGKTVSARHYANWDRMQAFWTDPGHGAAAVEEIAAGSTVFYTAPVFGAPSVIEKQIGKLRYRLHSAAIDVRRQIENAEMRRERHWTPPGVKLPGDSIDSVAAASIIRITGGNFRLLNRLLTQVERILEINALPLVTKEVVEAARENLVIGQA